MFFGMISSPHCSSCSHLVKTPLYILPVFHPSSVNIITGCDVHSGRLLIIFIAILHLSVSCLAQDWNWSHSQADENYFLGGGEEGGGLRWSRVVPPHSNIGHEKQLVLLAPASNTLAHLG